MGQIPLQFRFLIWKLTLATFFIDEACQPKPDHNNPTQDTSKSQSSSLKTPTTETANSLNPSTPENKKSKKPTKSNKKLKLKNGQEPKENTTSPSESKTKTKVKTTDSSDSQPTDTTDANPPYVKLVKTPRNAKSKKSCVSQKVPKCPPETKNNEDSKKTISSNNNIDTQPTSAADPTEPENSTARYDTLVCYAKENRQIALELKKFLETDCGLHVCIDFQNFMPGKPTTDNITESIKSSGSVIFLLSSKFPEKLWAPYELNQAVYNLNESIKDGKHKKIIPVLLEKCKVPKELKIYTAIKLEGSGSRKDCWKKLAAAISGTSYSNDNDSSSGNGCNDDEDDDHGNHNTEDNGDGEENDSEENDGETSNDDGANNEGTIGISDCHNSDNDDDSDDGDDGDDEDVNDNDLDQDGEDTVHGSNEAESNDDDDSSSSDNDDGIDEDKDGSENSSHDSDNDDNQNCGVDDVAGNNSNDAGDIVDSSHNNCEDEVSDDVEGGNSAEVNTNNVVVHGNASGDSAGVSNVDNNSKDGYGAGKIDSL